MQNLQPVLPQQITTPNPFDSEKYKRTTFTQWQEAADAWDRFGPEIRAWLGPATLEMLDMAGVSHGQRVLDLAAGAGDQTLQIAERVGPGGHVLATDLSPAILAHASTNARAQGHFNVETRTMDGENLELPNESFDVVVSRVGLIYFPNQLKALQGMHRVLVPGGRVAAMVYSSADKNGFFSIPVGIIRRRAALGPPLPGQPGPFSLGSPEAITRLFETAGFQKVEVRVVAAPLCLASADACMQFERESFGALHQMLSGLDDAARADAWQEIHVALRQFETPTGFRGPCEMILAVGTK